MQSEIVTSFEYNTINSAKRTIFIQQIVHKNIHLIWDAWLLEQLDTMTLISRG